MPDQTETVRRHLVAAINANPESRVSFQAGFGQVRTHPVPSADVNVIGFAAPPRLRADT